MKRAPTKIWYTRIAYGIGGDIVYEPRKGLFTLELASGQTNTVLEPDLFVFAIKLTLLDLRHLRKVGFICIY